MKIKIQIIITVITALAFISACNQVQKRGRVFNSNNLDTLKIGYLDTLLTGKQLFPTVMDSNKIKDVLDEKVLLCFESGKYYYVFYNKKKTLDVLSNDYWNKEIPKYINFTTVDGLPNYTRFRMINYDDPFLTGMYNSKDSMIVQNQNLRKGILENIDQVSVNYFSTTDTLLKLDNNLSVGNGLKDIFFKLHIPNDFKPKDEFELVLLDATTQIDAWYKNYPAYCADYSNVILLSIKNNRLNRIQYLDLEYIDLVFRQKKVLTRNVHYN